MEFFQREASVANFERGSFIYHQGEHPNNLYFLESGLVGLVILSSKGKERLVRIIKVGNFLSHRALLAEEPYHASAKVIEKSLVKKLAAEHLYKFLDEHPAALRYLTRILARDLRRAESSISHLSEATVTQRVAESLVFLLEQYSDHQWTRQEIAEFVGSTTPTVFRVMAYFESRGWIKTLRRKIQILDRKALLSLQDTDF